MEELHHEVGMFCLRLRLRRFRAPQGVPRLQGARIGEIEAELAGCGRVLVRPSGTEALVRVMLEGPDEAMLHRSAEDLAALLRARLS